MVPKQHESHPNRYWPLQSLSTNCNKNLTISLNVLIFSTRLGKPELILYSCAVYRKPRAVACGITRKGLASFRFLRTNLCTDATHAIHCTLIISQLPIIRVSSLHNNFRTSCNNAWLTLPEDSITTQHTVNGYMCVNIPAQPGKWQPQECYHTFHSLPADKEKIRSRELQP